MSGPAMMDKMFHIIMRWMVQSGQSPHYTEIATELGLAMEDGREALHDLFSLGIGGWLVPGTDLIASLAPISNIPNQYRITVDGQQKWFGQ